MDAKVFQEMSSLERAESINKLLLEFDDDHLKNAAKAVGMKYSAFCKIMREGGFTYSQSKKQYEKTISLEEYKEFQTSTSIDNGSDEAVRFIVNHLNELKQLLNQHETQLLLDPKVYAPDSKSVTKSIVVNKEIYEEFSELCTRRFSHLRLKDIVSNCLYDFVKQNKKTPS
ncbi:hypothetical protein J2Z23_002140 [Lederbergia galactosidilyticus]|uniref:hypothetical protein n=1 Tax=Lederbergia galactosidilytica TaxID=217031 RepID=UPI001AE58484|nr:hypothetical protein [Lederbergia galactosidilytica]MBP1915183.1 hypothetical protein [Lederbergia galactosidilytica]